MSNPIIEKIEKELMEKLADIEHQRWADWQRYVHSKILPSAHDGIMEIGEDLVKHWTRQIDTPYTELSEKEKESDREQVRRYLPLISQKITELLEELAKEAIGEERINTGDSFLNKDDEKFYYDEGWNLHRQEVISVFERRGIKLIEAKDFKRK